MCGVVRACVAHIQVDRCSPVFRLGAYGVCWTPYCISPRLAVVWAATFLSYEGLALKSVYLSVCGMGGYVWLLGLCIHAANEWF